MRYKYEIEYENLGETSNFEPRFACKHLTTYGNTLDECLDNAEYSFVDQDGDDFASGPADDNDAVDYITRFVLKSTLSIGINPVESK